MSEKITHSLDSSANNKILIKKDTETPAKEYVWLNGTKIITGVENEARTEIVKNEDTGLNYARVAVEGQEIYNRPKCVFSSWFLLDLETGSRGWYPGCEIHGDITGENVKIYKEPNTESEVVEQITAATVKILEIDAIDQEPFNPGWYKIRYTKTGYVQKSSVSNIRYEDPFTY